MLAKHVRKEHEKATQLMCDRCPFYTFSSFNLDKHLEG